MFIQLKFKTQLFMTILNYYQKILGDRDNSTISNKM